ncbi:urea amidolyase family protein [Microbacterium sp. No. 7]|uniref:5-oxoprolinase subunit B/C family protein n=1 Tax=Microbacterium sp. No. 7 TaxID=1714373 RepID=UPI0006D21264|nr:urea amidolyase family protein [Microbacterium sp. No. 7]ALJ20771.1 hypothetical protein AOA12_13015 [Microbacterium sp. No. 7]
MRFLPFGTDAVLIEAGDLGAAMAVRAALVAAGVPGVTEVTSAAQTVLVRLRPELADLDRLRAVAAQGARAAHAGVAALGETIEIPVRYDGRDLAEVAALVSLDVDEVVRRHSAATYRVAFTGFAPGFAYLTGGDAVLAVPRRATPRTQVPAGAVAVAGPYSAVYPRAGAGGWQLIGRTSTPLWSTGATPPALLRPGHGVRFVAVDELPAVAAPAPGEDRGPAAAAARVLRAATPALVQDLGRSGAADSGVPPGGAMDREAFRRANRLVGNPPDAAAIEVAGGGFALRAERALVVAVTGAAGPLTRTDVGGRPCDVPADEAVALDPGETLALGAPTRGVYRYVALRGGVDARAELGSRATDVLSGLGPDPLRAGDALSLRGRAVAATAASAAGRALPSADDVLTVRVVRGPRDDWFGDDGWRALVGQEWTVTTQSNRVGIRLRGAQAIGRCRPGELPSEGMVRGAIQVPPDGAPVVFAADHPVTGGYPVIATVTADDMDLLAQAPAGARVRLRAVAPARAHTDTEGDAR